MTQLKKNKTTLPKKKNTSPLTEFSLYAPDANEIYVVGDFVDWETNRTPMRKLKSGIWKKRMKLAAGRYEYRFIVDGNWQSDPENISRQPNPYGSENSILIVT